MWLTWLILIIAAYLIGSIPCAFLLVKLANGRDIRKFGSGNPGSTNSVRAAGPVIGGLVFLCDGLKSALPTLVGLLLEGPGLAACAGLAAFIGHLYPVWLRFEGGKGVACMLGMGLIVVPGIAGICFSIWVVLTLLTGYVSVGSCAGACTAFFLCLFTGQPWVFTLLFAVTAALVVLRHRTNIQHILDGTERKVLRRHKS